MMMTAACRVTSRRRSPRHALAQERVAARDDGGPVDPFDRDVLADGAGHDRVPFGLEAADRLHRVEGALGAPVILRVAVRVALQPEGGDARRRRRRLWDAATRDADPHDSAAHRSTSVPRPRSLARLYASVAVARSSRAKPTDLKSVTWAGLVRPGRVPATSSASSATTCSRAIAPSPSGIRRSPASTSAAV